MRKVRINGQSRAELVSAVTSGFRIKHVFELRFGPLYGYNLSYWSD